MSKPRAPHDPDDAHGVETGPLFARARTSDPETSKAAAREVTRTGAAARQANQALWCLTYWKEPLTSAEVAHRCGEIDRYMAARRLPELRDAGKVKNGEARNCSVTGRKALTWEVV